MDDRSFQDKLLLGNNDAVAPKKKNLISKLITAISNFSVQYNFQAVSIALIIMSASVCTSSTEDCKDGTQDTWVATTATATVFIGAITGQLTMGYAGDILGRNTAMILTLGLAAISALLSAVVPFGSASNVYVTIIVTRFLLGIGVGGVYPLSATKAAEDSGDSHGVDVTSAAWAFFWQVPGSMTPWLIALIMAYAGGISTNMQWRLLLGLGSIPATIVVILTFIEISGQKNNTHSSSSGIKQDTNNNVIWEMLREGDTWRKLLVTGGCWFIYDVAYYGVNLFGGEILKSIGNGDDDNVSSAHSIQLTTKLELIALSMGLPACISSIYSLKCMTTKTLQIYGFLFIAFCFILMASTFYALKKANADALFFIYCLLLFSLSYGPNLTTFVLPAETFPKKVRATFNGVSAACGKVGAFVGVYMFGGMSEVTSYPVVMIVCAIISVIGAIISYVYIRENNEDETFAFMTKEDHATTSLFDASNANRKSPKRSNDIGDF